MRTRNMFVCAALALPLFLHAGTGITDSESATHGADASQYQLVDIYRYDGFAIVQVDLPVLSQYSYLLVSGKEAMVVDPGRDPGFYLAYAKKESLKIAGVFLTHSHADFVAGHAEIVKATGCPVYQSAKSGAGYPHTALKDDSEIRIGAAVVKALETPGHTPDGVCGVVYSGGGATAEAVFTGDTLFIGSVGRPDLLEGTMSAAELASMGYDSWAKKLSKLPDTTAVLPAHGAGSLCGAHLSDNPVSTIGEEKATNVYLQYKSRSEFIAAILSELPTTPQYFPHNAKMNREGPPVVDWNATPREAAPDQSLADATKTYVVDLREAQAYAEGHIPNSVNIALRGRFETWTGTMVPWEANLVLAGSADELTEAVKRLHRVGYTAAAVITMDAWKKAGLPVTKNVMVKPQDLYAQMQQGTAPVVVDVRLPSEWMGLRIGTVANLPLNQLNALSAKLNPAEPVVTVCNSAYRSSMAVGILERNGFPKASSMEGGGEAWLEAGLPVFEATGHAAASPKRVVHLPERLSAGALKQLILDLPGTFTLVDIRPPVHFADYTIPGAQNVEIADLVGNAAYLTGAGPLIIVDRDGSLAMMVAGILSQKTQRSIKALHGGLEAYWGETELRGAVREVPLAPTTKAAPPAGTGSATKPQRPKKRSAGC